MQALHERVLPPVQLGDERLRDDASRPGVVRFARRIVRTVALVPVTRAASAPVVAASYALISSLAERSPSSSSAQGAHRAAPEVIAS